MSQIDEQIKGWLKEKFLASGRYFPSTQGEPDDIQIISVDMGWDCGCYSEYTRDDAFKLTAKLVGSNGREFEWTYGRWENLPDFITELDEYINNDTCYINDGA